MTDPVSPSLPGSRGRVHALNVSRGGVPKKPVPSVAVTPQRVEGDDWDDLRYHGGPDRAVCLFSLEVIERLRAEGHPIAPGTTGENVTLDGLDWGHVAPGAQLLFDGGVVLEITSYCVPCGTIRGSFLGGTIRRIDQEDHPGESRVYARVLSGGRLTAGEAVTLVPAG